MSTPVKYFAIFGVLLAVGLLAYNFLFKGQGVPTGSLLIPQKANVVNDSAAITELLIILRELQSLSIDTSIFEDKAYRSLQDNSVSLEVVPQGKANPFAPL